MIVNVSPMNLSKFTQHLFVVNTGAKIQRELPCTLL